MTFEVLLTPDAEEDLVELYDYIANHDSPDIAECVLGKFEGVFEQLAHLPARGAYPRELLALGIGDYREVFFKPYRIIYRVVEGRVYVLLVADGRRDMQSLLQRRLVATR